ncbi:MAG: PQQ-binding-like beta-propeller repeat protein [Patescibacteria group bacterium]
MNNKSVPGNETRLVAFRQAILKHAFVTRQDGARIAKNGVVGSSASWMFDFRALMLQPEWLDCFAELFWERYQGHLPFQVGGLETASIPLITAIVMKSVARGTPVNGFYLRKSRKRYDLMKTIEGTLNEYPIILIDDLINSGSTLAREIIVLQRAHKRIAAIQVILAFRDLNAYPFAAQGITLESFFSLKDFGVSLSKTSGPTPNQFDFLWHYTPPESPSFDLVVHKSTPALDTHRLFYGNDAGVFRALNQATGTVAWEYTIGAHAPGKGILSSPLISGHTVFFGAYDGNVYALDTTNGNRRWINRDADWIGSSPALAKSLGFIFIGLEFGLLRRRGGISAIDIHSGKTIWTARSTHLTHASPLYVEKKEIVFIGGNNGTLSAYQATSGTLLWKFQTGGDIKMAPAYDEKRNLVFAASMDSKLYALDVDTGKPMFAFQATEALYSSPFVKDDTVFIASLDKRLYAIDLDTHEELFHTATNGRIFSSPYLADDSVWVGSNDGKLYELDPKNGTRKSVTQFPERIVSEPAFNPETGNLFVTTVSNEVYCLRRKKA